MSAALRVASTRAEMLPLLLDQVLLLMNAEGAVLEMRDPASGDIVTELGRGAWVEATGLRTPAGQGLSEHVLSTGQPYINNHIETEPRIYGRHLFIGLRAAACVPLLASTHRLTPESQAEAAWPIVHEQAVGVLWVGRRRDFSPSELRLLIAIGDIAATAIHRATLHEQTEHRLRQLSTLRAIDQTISASLDLRLTLNQLLDHVTTQLKVDAAAVLLYRSVTQSLEYAAGRGFYTKAVFNTRLRLGEGHAGRAALERRLIGLPDLAGFQAETARAALVTSEGFRAYYGVPLIAKGQLEGVLEVFHRAPITPDQDWLDFLEALAGQAVIAINNAELFEGLQRSNMELALAYDATIEGWSHALDLRDKETEGHTQRVAEMAVRLAQAMGLDETELVHVRRGALLHDIGKMGVPDSILLKPGQLTGDEWVIMRQHPVYAYDMLTPIAYLRPALDILYSHHEKWDGTGYPRGLKGQQIPLAARIFAVVDVWDALRSDRPYRPAWPADQVREFIRAQAGCHFDPQVAEVFLRLMPET